MISLGNSKKLFPLHELVKDNYNNGVFSLLLWFAVRDHVEDVLEVQVSQGNSFTTISLVKDIYLIYMFGQDVNRIKFIEPSI